MRKRHINIIIIGIWSLLLYLTVINNLGQMVLAILFTVFILNFSETISKKYIGDNLFGKIFSFIFSLAMISIISYSLYRSVHFMWMDLNILIDQSEELIINQLKVLGFSESITTISDTYSIVFDYLKSNLNVLTFSAGLILKVLLGVILGILFYFSKIATDENDNAWNLIMGKIRSQAKVMFNSFNDIMIIQVSISIMNTIIISIFALVITEYIYGAFLPYWYVVIPLTAIISLIPVVGNIMLNFLLLLSTIQISPIYAAVGIGMFLVMHKLEFLIIGSQMEQKIGVSLVIVLISMILGESLFHSMSGMFLGLIILVTLSRMLKEIKIENELKIKINEATFNDNSNNMLLLK